MTRETFQTKLKNDLSLQEMEPHIPIIFHCIVAIKLQVQSDFSKSFGRHYVYFLMMDWGEIANKRRFFNNTLMQVAAV